MGLAYLRHEVSENTGKDFPVSAAKSRSQSRTQPGRNGGTLKVGGTNPGAGRPADEFKAKMRELASSEATLTYLQRCIEGKEGPKAAASALAFAAERGYGKEAQVTKVVGDAVEPLVIKVVKG